MKKLFTKKRIIIISIILSVLIIPGQIPVRLAKSKDYIQKEASEGIEVYIASCVDYQTDMWVATKNDNPHISTAIVFTLCFDQKGFCMLPKQFYVDPNPQMKYAFYGEMTYINEHHNLWVDEWELVYPIKRKFWMTKLSSPFYLSFYDYLFSDAWLEPYPPLGQ